MTKGELTSMLTNSVFTMAYILQGQLAGPA